MILQDADEFVRDMKTLAETFGEDLSWHLNACKPTLLTAINENFESQSTVGQGWPARKDAGFSHPLLNLSGSLKSAATSAGAPGHIERIVDDGDGQALELGVDKGTEQGGIPGAAIHNYGGVIRPVRKQFLSWIDSAGVRHFAKQVTIPQREYLAVGEDTIQECADKMSADLAGVFG